MNENIIIKRASRLAIAATTLAIATVLAVGAAPAHAINDTLCSPGPTPSAKVLDSVNPENLSGNVKVVLSNKACHYVKVHWATQANPADPHPATANVDYTVSSGDIVIAPGSIAGWGFVPLADDGKPETAETFVVTLTNLQGATMSDATGVITIVDEVAPR